MAACLALAGCGNTTTTVLGAAVGGVAAVGSAAVGAVTAVGTAGASAAGAVLGTAGSAAAGIAGTGAVTAGAVTPPAAAAAVAAPGIAAAAVPASTVAGGATGAEVALGIAGAGGAALLAQQALGAAGAEAVPTAESLLSSTRSEVDRCALQVYMGIVVAAGEADGARFALWLNQQAESSPAGDAMSGFRLVAEHIQRHLSRSAEQLRVATASLMDVEPERARQAFDTARDVRDRCPASAAQRLTELVGRDEPRST